MNELEKLKKSLSDAKGGDVSYLEIIRALKESNNYSVEIFNEIANELEELLGPAEMWNVLRPGFSTDELIENLEYITRETDM